jgi:hypothetical protein
LDPLKEDGEESTSKTKEERGMEAEEVLAL